MNRYIISCCSTADLSEEHFIKRNIKYVCFHFELNGKEYKDDLGKSIPFSEFYKMLKMGADGKTSHVSIGEFEEYFEKFLKDGFDIFHISTSSGLSGSFNAAQIAKKSLIEKYPDRKIYIVDSLAASSGFGLLVDKAADLRDSGMDIDQLYNWIEENKLRVHHWFSSSDLSFFVKGGRLSKISGTIGKILNICPVMNVDKFGKLVPRFKPRGKEKAFQKMLEQMEIYADGRLGYNSKCYISNSNCLNDAKYLGSLISEKFTNMKNNVKIYDIGTTIGTHTGPGTVALFFWGDKRID